MRPLAFLTLLALATGCGDNPVAPDDGLPPDPGEVGRQTVEGVDRDGDGVRDDVQRRIALAYTDPEVRTAMVDFAVAAQSTIVDASQGNLSGAHVARMDRAADCLVVANPAEAVAALQDLIGTLVNTRDRTSAYLALDATLSGRSEVFEESPDQNCAGAAGPSAPPARRGGDRVTVMFSNGLFNDWAASRANSRALAWHMRERGFIPAGFDVAFGFSYNQPEQLGAQLSQVIFQATGATYGTILNLLAGNEALPAWFTEWIEDWVASLDEIAYVVDADLQQHVTFYESLLAASSKVVIVAHSQGNFYANLACRRIDNPGLGIVAVATPASRVCNDYSPYATSRADLVIAGIARGASWTMLPPNVDDSPGGTRHGHGFVDDYLEASIAGPIILGEIRDAIQSLPPPAQPPTVDGMDLVSTDVNDCTQSTTGLIGTRNIWDLTYSDVNGDVGDGRWVRVTTSFEGVVYATFEYQPEYLSGDGFTGVLDVDLCARFGDWPYMDNDFTLIDDAGNESDPVRRRLQRPPGAPLTDGPAPSVAPAIGSPLRPR